MIGPTYPHYNNNPNPVDQWEGGYPVRSPEGIASDAIQRNAHAFRHALPGGYGEEGFMGAVPSGHIGVTISRHTPLPLPDENGKVDFQV